MIFPLGMPSLPRREGGSVSRAHCTRKNKRPSNLSKRRPFLSGKTRDSMLEAWSNARHPTRQSFAAPKCLVSRRSNRRKTPSLARLKPDNLVTSLRTQDDSHVNADDLMHEAPGQRLTRLISEHCPLRCHSSAMTPN